MWIHIAHFFQRFFSLSLVLRKCSLHAVIAALGHLFLIMFICAHECIGSRHPYTQTQLGYISCGETVRNTPQNDDVTSNNNNNATQKKSEKSTPSKYTFDHLALGVHNIFISYFFSTFFLVSSFHSFSCGVVRCVRDGGKKDENGIDRIPYWTSTWMLNMMISSLSYAYFERRSFLTHVFRCATHILMCRIAQRVVWSVEKLSARHKTQM